MELIQICEYNGEAVTTSRAVAEQFGKQHNNVIRDVENIIAQLKNEPAELKIELSKMEDFAERNFILSEYTDTSGKKNKQYILTRDGFTLLAMGFTGAKAMQFKVAYINAFNRMESIISGENRLGTAKQEAARCIEQVNSFAEGETFDGVVQDSLRALREAYAANEIAFRYTRSDDTKGGGDVVGTYDDLTVRIIVKDFYYIYASRTQDPLPFILWRSMIRRVGGFKVCQLHRAKETRHSCIAMSRDIAKLPL